VANQPSCPMLTSWIERFRRDLRQRHPVAGPSDPSRALIQTGSRAAPAEPTAFLRKLPPEVGVLLMVVGVAGLLLPGPVGSPFVVAGGISLWHAGFRRAESWFQRVAPGMYRVGIEQIERYLADLEHRYPGSVHDIQEPVP
jgi:hypothetical protein